MTFQLVLLGCKSTTGAIQLVVAQQKQTQVQARSSQTLYQEKIQIPPVPPSSLGPCSNIDIGYYVAVGTIGCSYLGYRLHKFT